MMLSLELCEKPGLACESCGCLLKLAVSGGLRCLVCWPPKDLPESVRQVLPSLRNASLVDCPE